LDWIGHSGFVSLKLNVKNSAFQPLQKRLGFDSANDNFFRWFNLTSDKQLSVEVVLNINNEVSIQNKLSIRSKELVRVQHGLQLL
jgi:hypothetical protein